jgi:HlyD family secretion protein
MTATVAIEVERHRDVLKVPNAALRFVPPLPPAEIARLRAEIQTGESILWTPGVDGNLEPRRVKVGLVGEKESEVEGEGLGEGLAVAVTQRQDDEPRARRGFSLF